MNSADPLVMIVDDNVTNIEMLAATLRSHFRLAIVKSGEKALELTQKRLPDLILLDIMMPVMSGFEVCEALKQDRRTRDIPIIFITAVTATDEKTKGFGLGAVDYITKPFHASEVLARVRTHLALRQMQEALEEKNRIIAGTLKEKRRQLDTLVDNLPGMVYRARFDGAWRTCFVSDGCRELTGYNPRDFTTHKGLHHGLFARGDSQGKKKRRARADDNLNKEIKALSLYPSLDDAHDNIHKALKKNIPFKETYPITTASGEDKWVWEQGIGIYDEQGNLTGMEGFISDITEKQKEAVALCLENRRLKSKCIHPHRFDDIIGASPAMQKVYKLILKAACQEDNVIIYGASGTGKELVARSIHTNSNRSRGHFVPVNCGAIHESLFESEFFGHKKGAFSGATTDKIGLLDRADGGTLFLDELGEISLGMQVKLLRVMDGNGYIPVGGTRVKKPDIRFVAATNRDLKKMVRQKKIREDFFFRIHIIPITLPPLKQRREDIPLLIQHFLDAYPQDETLPRMTDSVVSAMVDYHWPGNIRQLQNVLYQYLTLGQLEFLDPIGGKGGKTIEDAGHDKGEAQTLKSAMEEYERKFIEKMLALHGNRKIKVAEALGIDRKTLFRKMKHHNINI
ncbi:DNA-binding transcriptional response regulator, NtrC family, contains REC, AAA-type ATPase, and a Fis-type DNA-binding domains [Desulfocicer vacuolatum DSM 3385]|uniref:DNA-binding transcriptional response regulator, NtrC family, contains REC, AAA-type ATPase, and a Fis-type DNA-binding domains n=1 Tax=Desulfocicer vacuolatum DSM 3385 TaxID=1121400 RepID=A0A1W2DJW8_9BACT|nr:sigma 54-interacting transcriptional regulator [Desulfocicer vacuolatum]SMC97764.1 DNA-binding transcriptional response regulator, NtrC family, contains REC, AAA-type ATPase, and a Fis-type DNA-binding domains [Desulfocicer vacuolatum DSM 3385]